jgi:galactokinase
MGYPVVAQSSWACHTQGDESTVKTRRLTSYRSSWQPYFDNCVISVPVGYRGAASENQFCPSKRARPTHKTTTPLTILTPSSDAVVARLVDVGLSATEGEAKAALFARALAALEARAGDAHAWWVPGRIEFLGKHTDYAGGRSLLCAAERGLAFVAVPRADGRVSVRDACSGATADGELSAELAIPREEWSNYLFTVCRRVARNFPGRLHGVDLAFASDLPPAAGLSSSSALVVGTFLVLSDTNDLSARPEYRDTIGSPEDLAGYLGAVENGQSFGALAGDRGVGTLGGSQDHTAILCARPGALAQYAFSPVRFEKAVPLPNDHVLVVAVSGVAAPKTGSARAQYNLASERAAEVSRVLRKETGSAAPSLAAALRESPDAIDRLRAAVERHADSRYAPESLVARAEQLRAELEIIDAAADALVRGDLDRLGVLVDRSQANAERLLGNQVPETIALARMARELGAVAASAFGAGFGGSVYALVRTEDAQDFRRRWAERYGRAFPERAGTATFFVTRAGPRATRL